MFTDMVGYSRRMQEDEALALELLKEHWEMARPLFPEYGGREIKTIGDAFMIEFSSALKAVECAIRMQTELAERNRELPHERQIVIRVGIHMGDVEIIGDDAFGDGVNIAARVEPKAPHGGIAITEPVYQQAHNKVQARFESAGFPDLKNISSPIQVFTADIAQRGPGEHEAGDRGRSRWVIRARRAVAGALVLSLGGVALWGAFKAYELLDAAGALGTDPYLVVLPVSNFIPEAGTDYVTDGLHEDLLDVLQDVEGLRLVSRTTSASYRNREITISEVVDDLGVDAILETSLRRSGDEMVLTVQLINDDDEHLFSERYARPFSDQHSDHHALATDVVRDFIDILIPRAEVLTHEETERQDEVSRLYRLARMRWEERTEESLARAIDIYQEVIALDPTFVAAYTGLADAHMLRADLGKSAASEALIAAMDALAQAQAIDPRRSDVRATEGLIQVRSGKLQAAERSLMDAIKLDGGNVYAYLWLAEVYEAEGELERAAQTLDRGLRLEALHAPLLRAAAELLEHRLGRHAEAAPYRRRLIDLEPQRRAEHLARLAEDLRAGGDVAGSVLARVEATRDAPYFTDALLALAADLAALGEHEAAAQFAEGVLALEPGDRQAGRIAALNAFAADPELAAGIVDDARVAADPMTRGLLLLAMDRDAEALAAFESEDKWRGASGELAAVGPNDLHRAQALLRTGDPETAQEVIAAVESRLADDADESSPAVMATQAYVRAQIATLDGRYDAALDALREAATNGFIGFRFAAVDPILTELAADPRFMRQIADGVARLETARQAVTAAGIPSYSPPPRRVEIPLSEQEVERVVGYYEMDADTMLRVMDVDGELHAQRTGGQLRRIGALTPTEFFFNDDNSTLRFEADRGPLITHALITRPDGSEEWLRRIDPAAAVRIPSVALPSFTGWFQEEGRDEIGIIEVHGRDLYLTTTGSTSARMVFIGEDRFRFDPMVRTEQLVFRRDPAGSVVAIEQQRGIETRTLKRIEPPAAPELDMDTVDQLAGTYSRGGRGEIEIVAWGDGSLIARVAGADGQRTLRLMPRSATEFYVDPRLMITDVQFIPAADGGISALAWQDADDAQPVVWERSET